jgi:hypothetical protein
VVGVFCHNPPLMVDYGEKMPNPPYKFLKFGRVD